MSESRHTGTHLERDVNGEQHRSSDKSYGTTGRQRSQPGATAKGNGPSYESYSGTTQLHRTKEDAIEEFVRQHGTISLDWYVPDLLKGYIRQCVWRICRRFSKFAYVDMGVCVWGKCLLTSCERVIQKKTLNPFDVSTIRLDTLLQ